MTSLTLDFAQMFAPHEFSDAERDAASLLKTCPIPRTESDWEWEAAREAEEWRIRFAYEAAEQARQDDRLSQECPWLRLVSEYDMEDC